MPEIKTKVSLYFPKDLFKKFEKLRTEKEGLLGVTISKNEFALKLIKDAIENNVSFAVADLSPEYQAALLEKSDDELIQMILNELKSLRVEIDELKKREMR